jgi:transcription antitermination factor NusG
MGPIERELSSVEAGAAATARLLPWMALMVKPRRECAVQEGLEQRGLQTFLPMYWATHRWSDRLKRVKVPLFPQYLFCRADRGDRTTMLCTPGVRSIVSFGAEMIAVPEKEIEQIQLLVSSDAAIEPWPFLRLGQRIRVDGGPLCGLEGILTEVRNTTRIVVGLELLQRSVAVELRRDQIRPLD